MKKNTTIAMIVAATAAGAIGIAATQFTLYTIGNPGSGSTHLLLRTGVARNMPFFASDEQHCSGAGLGGWTCKRMAANVMVSGGPHHLMKLPYMGFVHSLSMSLSSDN